MIYRIKGLAVSTESTFGVASTGSYARVNMAGDIQFEAKSDAQERPVLKSGIWKDAQFVTTKAGSTLSFSVPLHSFLPVGSTYSAPANHQLADLLKHCMGTSSLGPAVVETNGNGSTYTTGTIDGGVFSDFSAPGLYAMSMANSITQARNVTSSVATAGPLYNATIAGSWLTTSGAATSPLIGDTIYGANNICTSTSAEFPSSFTFEVWGDTFSDVTPTDAYILTGCCGTFSVNSTVGAVPMVSFSFSVSNWTETYVSNLQAAAIAIAHVTNVYSDPLISTYGQVSAHYYLGATGGNPVSSSHLSAVSWELTLGNEMMGAPSINCSNGVSRWVKTGMSTTGSITVYFTNNLYGMFNPASDNFDSIHIYIQTGNEPGKMCGIYIPNAIVTEQLKIVDIGGISGHQINFRTGYSKLTEAGNSSATISNQADSDLRIGFF